MKTILLALSAFFLAGLSMAVAADEKIDVKKLVGKWEAVKVDEGTLPKGTIVEFTADGKMKVIAKKGDKDETIEGTYKTDATSFTYTLSIEKKEFSQKITIKKLSADELDTTSADNKNVTFKKAK
ncbi:MAG: TIGR03066 family protein [Planctomycetes bacterium]|nr:TIGR03066 family protein [Planctomycetota bacterium]